MDALETRGLYKSYDGFTAIDNLNLAVPEGSIFGLIGPNGAGKSTLIRMLTGIIHPDKGDAFILGRSIREKDGSIRNQVGYVPDVPVMYPSFSVDAMYQFACRLYPGWDKYRCRQLRDSFNLPGRRLMRQLSRGEKVQVNLVIALSLRPRLLLLDEPTAGLDPVVRRAFMHTIIEEVAQQGTTVFYSTHNLNDLEESADHIAALYQGGLLFTRSLDELKESFHRLQIIFEGEPPGDIRSLPGVIDCQRAGHAVTIIARSTIDELKTAISTFKPVLVKELDLGLEDIFIALMKERGYSYDHIT
jgi:ABC-2 type transport system ATP-binding protein